MGVVAGRAGMARSTEGGGKAGEVAAGQPLLPLGRHPAAQPGGAAGEGRRYSSKAG